MASLVVTCLPSDTDREIMTLMTDRRFRHLPVLNNGALVGTDDVVKSRIDGIAAEAVALLDYIQRG